MNYNITLDQSAVHGCGVQGGFGPHAKQQTSSDELLRLVLENLEQLEGGIATELLPLQLTVLRGRIVQAREANVDIDVEIHARLTALTERCAEHEAAFQSCLEATSLPLEELKRDTFRYLRKPR